MGTEVVEGSGDEMKVILEVDAMNNVNEVVGLIIEETELGVIITMKVEDNMGDDANLVGKDENNEEAVVNDKQHFEEIEQASLVVLG